MSEGLYLPSAYGDITFTNVVDVWHKYKCASISFNSQCVTPLLACSVPPPIHISKQCKALRGLNYTPMLGVGSQTGCRGVARVLART